MSEGKKPREFYIEFGGDPSKDGECYKRYSSTKPFESYLPDCEVIHCVEKRAYDSLAAKLDKAINALNKVQSFGLHHYEDCSNSDCDENPCSCGMEKTELLVLKTLDEIKEIKE